MKPSFIIFFSVFITLYCLVNYYIFIRGLHALPKILYLKYIYIFLFILLSISYIAGRFLEKAVVCSASDTLIWIGSLWLAYVLYFILILILIDLSRVLNYFFGIYPSLITDNYSRAKFITFLSAIFVVSVIVITGFVNANSPKINTVEIKLKKNSTDLKILNIVFVSDIHMGTIIRNSRLLKMVGDINKLEPDIVLLGGDIVDEDLAPVIEQNLGDTLSKIKSKYGTYAITGNHEYIGGVEEACVYLKQHNVDVLRDEVILIDNSFYLAGREDYSSTRFIDTSRKSIASILKNSNRKYPVILMDHQPVGLGEAENNKIDLQLSGHTHNGQLWPIHIIPGLTFELAYGYKKKGDANFYVSSGYGTWGPPVRVGNRPEIVNIKLYY